jgi:hypothetical protein
MLDSVAEIVIMFVVSFLLSLFYIYSNTEDICFTTCLRTLECVTMHLNIMVVLLYCKIVRVTNEWYKHVKKRPSGFISHAYKNNCVEFDNIFHERNTFVIQENALSLLVTLLYFRSLNGLKFHSLWNILSDLNYVVSLIKETYGFSVLGFAFWLLFSIIIVLFLALFELKAVSTEA